VLVLAFDTSSPAVTVALSEVPTTLAARVEVATNRHGELLAPLISEVLAEAGATASDLSAIAVGLGPGPFTGLRVGIVTAKSMADALGIPVYAECSLDVIAHELSGVADDHAQEVAHPFAVLSDARRKQVYWARYNDTGDREAGPDLAPPASVAEALAGTPTFVAGAGALLYRGHFGDRRLIEAHPYPSAATLAAMVQSRALQVLPGDDLTPLYLRRPDAQPPGAPKKVTPV
jgi:tRNA threonylcarbamoyl adenosine modification protein YeaZ